MFVVIFRARARVLDDEYARLAARLRELALARYGCREFISLHEQGREIALSYWDDEAAILAWKRDAEHLLAQELGRSRWYAAYRVEVAEIRRAYGDAECAG